MKKFIIIASLAMFAAALPVGAEVKMSDAGKKATARALEWLKDRQNEDGSFSDNGYDHNTAITGYAMLAFMSQGHLPNQGLYGPEVAKAARFLRASQKEDGYLVGARGGNMYAHGMATLALCELWGQTNDEELKPVISKAVKLILGSQNQEGGWRYNPVSDGGADISVTIMQVMALRSAKNAGLSVPDVVFEGDPRSNKKGALDYIEACYNDKEGGFTYMPRSRGAGFARTAAGTCVLFLSGKWDKIKKRDADGKPIEPKEGARKTKDYSRAVKFLQDHFMDSQHFYYGHYYAAHSMHSVGGKEWEDWYKRLEEFFLAPGQQADNGSWTNPSRREVGPVYQTSIAVIVLSAPAHYLPIFQN